MTKFDEYNDETLTNALKFIESKMNAELGGTNMSNAVTHAYEALTCDPGMKKIFLLTDGEDDSSF
jgi:uncharacterized protein with von Willebrand factor type A (vWA) domain